MITEFGKVSPFQNFPQEICSTGMCFYTQILVIFNFFKMRNDNARCSIKWHYKFVTLNLVERKVFKIETKIYNMSYFIYIWKVDCKFECHHHTCTIIDFPCPELFFTFIFYIIKIFFDTVSRVI